MRMRLITLDTDDIVQYPKVNLSKLYLSYYWMYWCICKY